MVGKRRWERMEEEKGKNRRRGRGEGYSIIYNNMYNSIGYNNNIVI